MIPNFTHHNEDGDLLVQDKLALVFFSKRFDEALLAGARAALDRWLAFIPSAALRWASVGANSSTYKKLTVKSLDKCRSLLDPPGGKTTKTIFFSLTGEEAINPSYGFTAILSPGVIDDETNLLEMRLPTSLGASETVETFVEFVSSVAADFPYDSGYASLILDWGSEELRREAAKIIVPLALRHPGMDVAANWSTRFALGKRCRGARWLTFLGKPLLAELGGKEALKASLAPEVELKKVGEGFVLRAGKLPEPGDFNRREDLPLVASVARAIEKVTFFGDPNMRGKFFNSDEAKLERWERRFLASPR